MEWQDISTAPKDGTWFLICKMDEGCKSYEVGAYEPLMMPYFVDIGDGLFRRELTQVHDWRGFNNFHRATHWMPLPPPPTT